MAVGAAGELGGARGVTRASRVRVRLRVTGTVQGVGFRPYVYRLARELGLSGSVLNDERGVLIEAEGDPAAVNALIERLEREAPPLAAIERVQKRMLPAMGESGFRILASERGGEPDAPVSPDTATCADCLAELFDASDRRYRYPFINCTNCGPRFTIVRGTPYDRPLTTMASFSMCELCRREYDDPSDRRFHAQPNACPDCGPRLSLIDGEGTVVAWREDALNGAVQALKEGAVVAVKGVGGFHLACLASDEEATAALRARKHREDKPFAVMALDVGVARELVELGEQEKQFLLGRERPIVIARRRADASVAQAVAPRSRDLGVMLPYSPLHHLLLADVGEALVMTSGNVSDEPIAYREGDALERLAGIADRFLVHDRPIETRTDDSVIRAVNRRGSPLLIRRSRGWVPDAVALPLASPHPVLACGAELKNTFCLVKGSRAWISHHIGDLENYETLRSFTEGIEHFQRLFAVEPEMVAHDLHPEYLSSKYALERDDLELVGVQHHHAHLAACLAEHGRRGPAVGAIYDGTGFGTDGTIWGGELLVGGLEGFGRAGHLWPVRLPGGAQAVREPWRMACAWLLEALGPSGPPASIAAEVSDRMWEDVQRLAASGTASPVTTSMGRLFDAVAALCGLRLRVNYEGQAAAELETACDPGEREFYPLHVERSPSGLLLDARATVRAVLDDLRAGETAGTVAARFHNAIASATASALMLLAAERGIDVVVLSGGSFQNRVLLERVSANLRPAGLRVLVPARLPPNDGGIAYGQAAIACALRTGSRARPRPGG
jgi:hydrogenase maturation protein HypF